jgi:hypothetical protein
MLHSSQANTPSAIAMPGAIGAGDWRRALAAGATVKVRLVCALAGDDRRRRLGGDGLGQRDSGRPRAMLQRGRVKVGDATLTRWSACVIAAVELGASWVG